MGKTRSLNLGRMSYMQAGAAFEYGIFLFFGVISPLVKRWVARLINIRMTNRSNSNMKTLDYGLLRISRHG
jgi:hypothetical protein